MKSQRNHDSVRDQVISFRSKDYVRSGIKKKGSVVGLCTTPVSPCARGMEEHPFLRMSSWWSLCTLYSSHTRWSYRRRFGSLLLCACSMCDVNSWSAVTSHCLLIRVFSCAPPGVSVSVMSVFQRLNCPESTVSRRWVFMYDMRYRYRAEGLAGRFLICKLRG